MVDLYTAYNAVEYTPDRDMIQVAARLRDDAKAVEVSVTNTGIGIPEADRSRKNERDRSSGASSKDTAGRSWWKAISRPAAGSSFACLSRSLPAIHQTNLFDQMRESNR